MLFSFYTIVFFVDIITLFRFIFHSLKDPNTHQQNIQYIVGMCFLLRSLPLIVYFIPPLETLWWVCVFLSLIDPLNNNKLYSLCLHASVLLYFGQLSTFWNMVLVLWVPNILRYIIILTNNIWCLQWVYTYYTHLTQSYIIDPMQHSIHVLAQQWSTQPLINVSDIIVNPCIKKKQHLLRVVSVRTKHTNNNNPDNCRWLLESLYSTGGEWCREYISKTWLSTNDKSVTFRVKRHKTKGSTLQFSIISSDTQWSSIVDTYERDYKSTMFAHLQFLARVRCGICLMPVGSKIRTFLTTLLGFVPSYLLKSTFHNNVTFVSESLYVQQFKIMYTRAICTEDWFCSETVLKPCLTYIYETDINDNEVKLLSDVFVKLTQLCIHYNHIRHHFPFPRNMWTHPVPVDMCEILIKTQNILVSTRFTHSIITGLLQANIQDHYTSPVFMWPILKSYVIK